MRPPLLRLASSSASSSGIVLAEGMFGFQGTGSDFHRKKIEKQPSTISLYKNLDFVKIFM